MKKVLLCVLLLAMVLALVACGANNAAPTDPATDPIVKGDTENDETTTVNEKKVELPYISEDMRLAMPEIKPDIRINMGDSYSADFEWEVDTFMAILKIAYETCLSDGDISRCNEVIYLANCEYEYLVEEIDDTIGLSSLDSVNFITSSASLAAYSILNELSCLSEAEKLENWEFLKGFIRDHSVLFYGTDILT